MVVLSCYNVGDYGVVELNKRLQNVINPNPESKISFWGLEFRLNDIVMNYVNDYKAVRYSEEFIDDKNTTFYCKWRIWKSCKDYERCYGRRL